MRIWWIVAFALVTAGCAGSSGDAQPRTSSTSPPQTAPPKVSEVFTPLPCNQNTTVGMEGCSEHRILRADTVVDRLVRLIWGNSTTAGKLHLAAAETAWAAYRKAACISESDKYAGGTLAPVVDAQCTVRLTRQHAAELRRQLRFLTSE